MKESIGIVGGGIAGLTTAIALNNTGYNVNIFEQAPEVKAIGAGLTLGANAIIALKRLGLMDEVIQKGMVIPFLTILDRKGKLISRANSRKISQIYGVDNFAIHRAELHSLLLSKLSPDIIRINKRAIDLVQKKDKVLISFQDGSEHECDYLLAADGIHSAIRQKMAPGSVERFAGYTCWRAVVDNTDQKLHESFESWGRGKRFGAVPLTGNKIYWYACINADKNDKTYGDYKVTDLVNEFKGFHDPVPSIIKECRDEDLLWNDIIDLKPINKYAFDNVLLMGDAAHATTPNMGQGACQAIEDAVVLADEMRRNSDIRKSFIEFEKRRLKRVHFITNTSWKLGKVAQWDNSFMVTLRDNFFRIIPSSINERQLLKLLEVDF